MALPNILGSQGLAQPNKNSAPIAGSVKGNKQLLRDIRGGLLGYLATGQAPGNFPGGFSLEGIGFKGPVITGESPLQSQVFGSAGGLLGGPEQMQRQATLSTLMGAKPSFSADPALRERYLQQSITDPAQRYFSDTVAPSIAARYGQGGNLGAAMDVTAREGNTLAQQLAGLRAGVLRGDEQLGAASQDTANQLAMQATTQSAAQQGGLLDLLQQLGGQQRGIATSVNQDELQRLLLQQPFGDPRLGLLSMLPQTTKYQPQAVSGGGPSGGGFSLLSGLAGLAGGGFMNSGQGIFG